jgi:hypothetical protein
MSGNSLLEQGEQRMTFEEWCFNNGYTQLDVDVYNFGKEVFNAGVAEGFEQAIIKECEEKRGQKNDRCTV